MQYSGWLLLVIAVTASATAEDKNTTLARGRKMRRGDNLIPRVISELTFNLKDELESISPTTNTIFSPVSITSALAMIMLGARGKTYKDMAKTLAGQLPGNLEKNVVTMHRKLKNLIERLEQNPESKPGTHITLANAVFVQKGVEVQDDFSRNIHNIYNSEVTSLNFGDSEAAATAINSWVDKHTKGSIKEIFSSPPDPGTQVVLANAIYFAGEWEYPFDPKETEMKPFHGLDGDFPVPMMGSEGGFYNYYESSSLNCTILGIPYKRKHVTMYFILPKYNLTDFLKEIELEDIMALKEKATTNEIQVILSIPKMKLESTINLQEPLSNMGMESLFGIGANLQGIAKGIFVNEAVHKINIEVTETGTIAAAVTVFGMTRMSHPWFNLNRPFLFFIYHEKAKVPLFWGSVFDPRN